MNGSHLITHFFLKIHSLFLSVDRKKEIVFSIIFCSLFPAKAQLILNNTPTPTQLVNLLTGPGVTISNVVYTGSALARGSFTAAGTNLGINSGVVLSTGNIADGVGPNLYDSSGVDFGLTGDPVLDVIAGANTRDAAILEFDFIPQNDTISFRYVFASEEYPEYVCSTYNDAFVFNISGPGIAGTQNMAILPGSAIPVAINTVNPGVSGAFGGGGTCDTTHSSYYVNNVGGTTLEFDGFTTVLTATSVVIPCQLYHLRIAIADAGDGVWDSAVFFDQGSLSSTPVIYAGVDQTFCKNAIVNLGSAAVSGWTYSWSPSVGLSNPAISNPVLTYTNNGLVPVVQTYTATASSGSCTLTDTVSITINPQPTATFNAPTPLCAGQLGTLTYTGTGSVTSLFGWNFSGASVIGNNPGPYQISFSSAGDYNVSLYVSEAGCSSPVVQNVIHVSQNPVAVIVSPINACAGDTITLTSLGSLSGSSAIYNWNFGTATVISGNNQGPFQVVVSSAAATNFSLTITDSSCVSNTATVPFTVKPLPLATVVAPINVCSGTTDTIFFVGSNLAASSYSWNFSNAQLISGTGAGPFVLNWNSTGDQTISVQVNDIGCIGKDISLVHVDLQPVASFSNLSGACMYDYVEFNFTGTADDSTKYNWSFVNGSISNSNNVGPHDLYWDRADTFSVSLITSNGTCRDTAIKPIIINEKPVADFSTTSVCLNDTSGIINNSYLPDSIGNIFDWTFGDTTTSNDFSPSHLYSTYGNYNAQLIITTSNGCKDTLAKTVEVYPLPKAVFATDTVCFGLSNHFGNYSSIANGTITTQSWNWRDTTSAIGNQSTHQYSQAGDYSVQLLVTSDKGCKDSVVNVAKVIETPEAIFNPDFTSGCVPLMVQLFDHTNSSDDSVVNWQWSFGDGFISNDSFPTHTYTTPGIYSLYLQVTTSRGCLGDTSLNRYVTVYPIPQADFSFAPESPDVILANVNFSDQSSPVNLWSWNFGDSTFSSDKNPNHLYDSAGVYITSLIVTTEFGCKDTTYREIVVKDDYTLWIPNAFTPNGDGKNDIFEVKSENLITFKMDIFDRWGTLIFTTENILKGWNGEVKNKKAQMDTYVYRIAVKDNSSKEHVYVGHLSLIY